MPKVLVHTLGCKLNALESESYIDAFKQAGYELFRGQGSGDRGQLPDSQDKSKSTIIIINTCTVTSKADQKARRVIRKALRDFPEATVIVTGCYAALEKEVIEKLFHTEFTETRSSQRLLILKREEVLNFLNNNSVKNSVLFGANFEFFPEKFSKHTRAFLKIQDGCGNYCTYCRIRLARGRSVSLPAEQVLERLRILEQNHAEAVLTGVNISQYRDQGTGDRGQGEKNLFDLLDYLLSNTEKIAIRLSSLDPQFIIENSSFLISHSSFIISNRIRPHFHLSIQSCTEKILKRMGRSYNAEIIEKAVSLLRSAKDDPFLACDIITGFPGETEEDFYETYQLCKKLDFAWIHVFPYSKRPGTEAASYRDTVKESEVTRRVQLLTELAWQGRAEYVKRWIGREVEVISILNEENAFLGLSENYLKALVKGLGEPFEAGTVLKCRLIKGNLSVNEQFDCIAENIKRFNVDNCP